VCGIEKKVVDFCVLYHSDANHQILLKKNNLVWIKLLCLYWVMCILLQYSYLTLSLILKRLKYFF